MRNTFEYMRNTSEYMRNTSEYMRNTSEIKIDLFMYLKLINIPLKQEL